MPLVKPASRWRQAVASDVLRVVRIVQKDRRWRSGQKTFPPDAGHNPAPRRRGEKVGHHTVVSQRKRTVEDDRPPNFACASALSTDNPVDEHKSNY